MGTTACEECGEPLDCDGMAVDFVPPAYRSERWAAEPPERLHLCAECAAELLDAEPRWAKLAPADVYSGPEAFRAR